jgi:hypothetical protein
MHRSLPSVLAALGALALLSGCGSDDDSAATTTSTTEAPTTTSEPAETEPEGADVDEWAESFCADLDTWRAGIGDLEVDAPDPEASEAARAAAIDRLDGLEQETDTLIATTEDREPPAIDDGEAFVRALLVRFEGISSVVASTRDEVEALPTEDPAAFQAGLDDAVENLQDQINLLAESFEAVDDNFDDPDLQAALEASCT